MHSTEKLSKMYLVLFFLIDRIDDNKQMVKISYMRHIESEYPALYVFPLYMSS